MFGDFPGFSFAEAVRAETDSDILITTRCDTDDVLLPGFVDLIQNQQNPEKYPLFVNLCNGYFYNSKTNKYHKSYQESNPFISVIEKTCDSKTVYDYGNHAKIRCSYDILNIKTSPQWIQVIHDNNIFSTEARIKTPPEKDHNNLSI